MGNSEDCWPNKSWLGSYVEELVQKPETEFNVVVVQENGNDCDVDSIHVLNIGSLRMKLSRGKVVVAKEFYSSSMQLPPLLLYFVASAAFGGYHLAMSNLRPKLRQIYSFRSEIIMA